MIMGLDSKKAQKRQHNYDVDILQREQQFNAEQAQQAYDRQRAFYDYQFQTESQYNSPLAQLQRYRQAGINPALMQMNEGNTNISASSPPAASASGSNTVNMAAFQSNELSAIQSVASLLNEFQKVQSEIDLNKTQAAKNVAEASKTSGVDTEKTHAEIKNILQNTEYQRSQTSNTEANTQLTKSQKENVEQQTENLRYTLKHLLPRQASEIESRISKAYNDIANSQQLTKAHCAELFQSISESVSRVNLNSKSAELVQKNIDAFERRLENELDISRETFNQLESQNFRTKLMNDLTSKLLNPKNGFESADGIFDYLKLQSLSTLNKIF